MANFAFNIASVNKTAILSGANDNEYDWFQSESDNLFTNSNIDDISLEITTENNTPIYNYTINISKRDFDLSVYTSDMKELLSETYKLTELLDNLLEDNDCKIIENSKNSKSVILNICGDNVTISEITIPLMRGKHRYINIKF